MYNMWQTAKQGVFQETEEDQAPALAKSYAWNWEFWPCAWEEKAVFFHIGNVAFIGGGSKEKSSQQFWSILMFQPSVR